MFCLFDEFEYAVAVTHPIMDFRRLPLNINTKYREMPQKDNVLGRMSNASMKAIRLVPKNSDTDVFGLLKTVNNLRGVH
ncbi:unnamed protein product [Colias eurytheme]|nr:unnamed protein product [Colias eurytheme]